MKVIVTGADGFIGRSLIKKLTENGVSVLAIDIHFDPKYSIESEKITRLSMSIDNISLIKAVINPGEFEAFYHLAWQGVNGPNKANIDIQVHNIEMAVNCSKLAKEVGCKKFLCSGTIAERSVESLSSLKTVSPGMIYGVAKNCTHNMIEVYCKNIGLDFIWMQFSNIYGPLNKTGNLVSYTLSEILVNRPAIFGPAEQPYDFIYIDDLIEAIFCLGVKPTSQNFYYIGSGYPRKLKDFLISIGTICQKPNLIRIGEREDDGIKYKYEMFDNASLVQDIGDYVSHTFEDGIRKTIKEFQCRT